MSWRLTKMWYSVSWKIKAEYGGGTREIRTREKDEALEAFEYMDRFPEIEDLKMESGYESVDLGTYGHAHVVNGMEIYHPWSVCDVNPVNDLDDISDLLYKEQQ